MKLINTIYLGGSWWVGCIFVYVHKIWMLILKAWNG